MKVFALAPKEDWICDQLVEDWNTHSPDMAAASAEEADVIWLLADWCWRSVPLELLQKKRVVTTVHHVVPEKFDRAARMDFAARDSITDVYHVYNQRAHDFVRPLTKKEVRLVPYWANNARWHKTGDKKELRAKHRLPVDGYLIGSFQRDTEGHDLKSPKLEKGPDLLADFLITKYEEWKADAVRPFRADYIDPEPHVVLAGWRRQYIMSRLDAAGVPYSYFERPPQETLNELYQTLDLYPVTARHEGGPQALIECGLLGVPVVSRPVGIAEQVLPPESINEDVLFATATVPDVRTMTFPLGVIPYRQMFADVLR